MKTIYISIIQKLNLTPQHPYPERLTIYLGLKIWLLYGIKSLPEAGLALVSG